MAQALHIDARPGQVELYYDGCVFRIAVFPDAPTLSWIVYGGQDGRVLVFKPESRRWEILRPTEKNNDYLFVSISKGPSKYFQPYVHQVILNAFSELPPQSTSVAKHINDDPKDNRAENLAWGSKSQNAIEAHQHRRYGTAPKSKRISIPIRRETLDLLRQIGPARGKPLEEFVESILMRYIKDNL